MELPKHLELVGHWADSTLTAAQAEQLSRVHERLHAAVPKTTVEQPDLVPKQQIVQEAQEAKGQLDQLSYYLDQLEDNLVDMELAMGMAESSLGLSIRGRLEQLTRSFFPSPAVPYLRQWPAPLPQPISPRDYLPKQH
ncbi:hypothetical protein EV183_004411 [Coemansia sp. RSA 2336]|nr:hypothetical protein EV183_004411 [Coemansia sp. RSA 2336]